MNNTKRKISFNFCSELKALNEYIIWEFVLLQKYSTDVWITKKISVISVHK